MVQSQVKKIFYLIPLCVLAFALLFGFQNCSPKKFASVDTADFQSIGLSAPENTCDPLVHPPEQEILSCPMEASGDGAIRARQVICDSGHWTALPWSNLDYSGCHCGAGKKINQMTGTCECPAGQAIINGVCKNTICDVNLQPPQSESGTCPSGKGMSSRSRMVTCQEGAWVSTLWSTWSYATCTCPASQSPNTVTGLCECPVGQVYNGTTCAVPTCDPNAKAALTETISCPAGSLGMGSRSRTASCSNLKWSYSDWVNDWNACTCAGTGQIFDAMKNPVCNCASGYGLVGGACQPLPKVCDPTKKPTDSQTVSCPAPTTGSVSSHRDVSCDTNTGNWSNNVFPPYNYGSCTCPYLGQSADPNSGSCSCSAGQYVIQGSCGVCPATSTYNPSTKICESNLPVGKMSIVAHGGFGFISMPPSVMIMDNNSVLWTYGLNFMGSVSAAAIPGTVYDSVICGFDFSGNGCRKLDCKVSDCGNLKDTSAPGFVDLNGFVPVYSVAGQNWCTGPRPGDVVLSGCTIQTAECGPTGWRYITLSNMECYYGQACPGSGSPYPIMGFQLSVKTGSRRLAITPSCGSSAIQWVD